MASDGVNVLRKNRAWLHGLIKENLSKVVPQLYEQEIVPQNAEQEELCKKGHDSTAATNSVWDTIEREVGKAEDDSDYMCKFIQVLIDCDIGHVDDLRKVIEKFRDKPQRSRRASGTESLNSSSSSVFSGEGGNKMLQESTESLNNYQRKRKSTDRKESTDSNASLGSYYASNPVDLSPQHVKPGSRGQEDDTRIGQSSGGAEGEGGVVSSFPDPLQQQNKPSVSLEDDTSVADHPAGIDKENLHDPPPANPQTSVKHLNAIPENPNSPDPVKRFTTQVPSEEPVPNDTVPSPGEAAAPVDDQVDLIGQQFSIEENAMMQQFVCTACRASDLRMNEVKKQYEKVVEFYERKLEEDRFAHEEKTAKLQSAIEHCKGCLEEEQQKYEETKQKLEERNVQLADKEKEINELKERKEMAEKLCQRLEGQLANARERVRSLKQSIDQKQLEIELSKSDRLLQSNSANTEKTVVKEKMDQWKNMQQLIDQLYHERDITHVKLAIVQKVNSIKTTGMRRPRTSLT